MERLTRASTSTILNKVNEIVDWINEQEEPFALRISQGDNGTPVIKDIHREDLDYETQARDPENVLEGEPFDDPFADVPDTLPTVDQSIIDEFDNVIPDADAAVRSGQSSGVDTIVEAPYGGETGEWHIKHAGFGKWNVINPEGEQFNEKGMTKEDALALVGVMDRKVA